MMLLPQLRLIEKDIGYICGFIDGEGYIGLKRNQHHGGLASYGVGFTITNSNIQALQWIRDKLKSGTIIVQTGHKKAKKHKIVYGLSFTNDEAKIILELLKDDLLIKQEQAYLVLEYLKIAQPLGSKNKDPDVVFKQELIFKELAELNKRGSDAE